eukprot:15298200-Ditylum_brightwellii.AAC.1
MDYCQDDHYSYSASMDVEQEKDTKGKEENKDGGVADGEDILYQKKYEYCSKAYVEIDFLNRNSEKQKKQKIGLKYPIKELQYLRK